MYIDFPKQIIVKSVGRCFEKLSVGITVDDIGTPLVTLNGWAHGVNTESIALPRCVVADLIKALSLSVSLD